MPPTMMRSLLFDCDWADIIKSLATFLTSDLLIANQFHLNYFQVDTLWNICLISSIQFVCKASIRVTTIIIMPLETITLLIEIIMVKIHFPSKAFQCVIYHPECLAITTNVSNFYYFVYIAFVVVVGLNTIDGRFGSSVQRMSDLSQQNEH